MASAPPAVDGAAAEGGSAADLGSLGSLGGSLGELPAAVVGSGELSVLPVPDGGDTVYRVCLGDYEARARAERLRDDMRVDYPGVWVAPR